MSPLEVEQIYKEQLGKNEEVTVYNFQVEDWHTYHVGELEVLVHNAEYESGSKGGTGERLIPGMEGVVTGGDSTKLGKNMMESMGLPRGTNCTGYQAQHIIPAEMANHPVLQRIGMDLDDASNGQF